MPQSRLYKNAELYDNVVTSIKDALTSCIDKEYSEYKLMCINGLETLLENKRGEIVKSILDNIDVSIYNNPDDFYSPTIQIKLLNKK